VAVKKQRRKPHTQPPAKRASHKSRPRRLVGTFLSRPFRWVMGLVVAAATALATSVLTGIPAELIDVPAAKDMLRSGPDLSISAEIVYLDDEGRSMAIRENVKPGEQLQRLMTQPGAGASPEFVQQVWAIGGVNLGVLTVRLIVEGRRNQEIHILDIRPDITERTDPLGGTLFDVGAQAATPTLQMMFDMDHPNPIAHEALLDPGTEELRPGRPFFEKTTVSVRDRERQVLVLRATANRHYVAFALKIDYRIGDENKTLVVNHHGKPFGVTGPHLGPKPDIMSYERAYQLQGDFSLCRLANPHRIPPGVGACAPMG
jgi:hypothetical protein